MSIHLSCLIRRCGKGSQVIREAVSTVTTPRRALCAAAALPFEAGVAGACDTPLACWCLNGDAGTGPLPLRPLPLSVSPGREVL